MLCGNYFLNCGILEYREYNMDFNHRKAKCDEAYYEAMKKLHNELYDILIEIQRVCEILGIKCFIQGGSAIGAFFDNAILPWDDDIDVGLKREDYELFIRKAPSLVSSDYFIQSMENEPNMPAPQLLKVRKNNTFFHETGWNELPVHHGIYVDIMPYDKVPDNQLLQKIQRRTLRKIHGFIIHKVMWKNNIPYDLPESSSALYKIVKQSPFSRDFLYRWYLSVSTRYNNRNCTYYNQAKEKRDHISAVSLDNLQRVKFGPTEAFVPDDVETYLKNHYPNLRRDIPEDEKENHLTGKIIFSDGSTYIPQL